MSDTLLALSKNSMARWLFAALKLPLPLPTVLERDAGPWSARPLHDRPVTVGGGPRAALGRALASLLAEAGADPSVVELDPAPFVAAGEAWGRPLRPESERPWALIFDGSGLRAPEELHSLYAFFHPRVRALRRSGRLVVLGRPPEAMDDPAAEATQRALEGFVRAAGKEIGRVGATTNLVTVASGAEDRLAPALRWLLSPRAAFVSGQPLRISADIPWSGDRPVCPLEGRIALVTGAARGIGAATAAALAREGARVVVLDRPADGELAEAVAKKIGGETLLADLAEAEAAAGIGAILAERHGRVDIIIHNAGITRDRTLARMDEGRWDQVLGINLGAIGRLHAALEPLIPGGGRVVCLSSIAGIAGNVGQTNYAASKAGVIGLVAGLARRLAGRGIAVNAVAPGFIETRMTAAIPLANREAGRRLASLAQGGLPEDVAEAITFLSSPGAAGLSGQILRVCGGSFIGA